MKVRWRQGSLRLRIGPHELASLVRGDPVREVLVFPGGASWAITIRPETTSTDIVLCGNDAVLTISTGDLASLASSEAEGVYFEGGSSDAKLAYFIEKDFPCLHPRPPGAAEPADAPGQTFAAPAEFAARHGK